MNESSVSGKIHSILQNEPQTHAAESIHNYLHYRSEKISYDLLEMVWDRTSDGMLLTDSDGMIVAVNHAFCAMVNMRESELLKLPFTVMYDRNMDRRQIFDEYKINVTNNSFVKKYEKRIALSSGQSLYAEVLTSILMDDANESFVLTEFRDINERKRWESSLHQSEFRYRSLFENSVLPMYQSTIDGKFLNANIALLKLLGYATFDELLQLNVETDVYINSQHRIKLVENLQNGEADKATQLELKKKDGSRIIVLAHSRILHDEHQNVVGFEGALEDITERTMLERQLQANIKKLENTQEELTKLNTQKDKILAIVSHDLRSPFCSILGFCDLLKSEFSTLTDKEKTDYIEYINEAAVQQLNLVNSLLDWSRLETGRIRVKFQPVVVARIAGDVMNSLRGIAMKKNIKFDLAVPAEMTVMADEQLVRQLLSNLISNALKFTSGGGTITIAMKEDSAHQSVLTVSDTGIGIPEEDLKKLFKVEEKYSRKGLEGEIGTGLGLPMCYEIMKKHQGSIEASSIEGTGTVFTLTFAKQVKAECKKILIVDDQKGNQLILSRFMKRISESSETIFAETGKEALELMKTIRPDLIMTDYHMPTMDGLEFIRRIRCDETMKNTPVIIISGDEVDYFIEADPLTSTLRKPIVFTELKQTMERIQF
ncbi:MAG: PAS domain S-box protein [Bacteroidota bacterium]